MNVNFERWAVLASHFIGDHLDACRPLLEKDENGLNPFVRFVSTQLYLSCHFSSESSLMLIRQGQEWDADIINRSVVEGVVKYVFMLQGTNEDKLDKAKEFWETLPDYSSIKRSDRIKKFLNNFNEDQSGRWRALKEVVLSDDEVNEFRGDSNKKERSLLAQKWSFSEIIQKFGKSEDKGLELFVHLAHNYGMSSHLIHKDGDGVAIVWDRMTRESNKRDAAQIGHISRIVSDLCTFSEMRSHYLYKACGKKCDFITALREKYSDLFEEIEKSQVYFRKIEYGV